MAANGKGNQLGEDMNESLKTRITGNTILARELRRKLSLRFGEGTRATEILASLSDEELIEKYVQHQPHRSPRSVPRQPEQPHVIVR